MNLAERILVVVEQSESAALVLEKAAMLAHAARDVEVQIIQVIYDPLVEFNHLPAEAAQAVKLELMQGEERKLVDIVAPFRERFQDVETFTVWHKRISEGVLHAAETFSAELIIKAQHPTRPVLPRLPDDWNLLRHAKCPVLLSGPEHWGDAESVLVAADLLDHEHDSLTAALLECGTKVARGIDKPVHVVCAYPKMQAAVADFAGVSADDIDNAVKDAALTQLAKLGKGELSPGTFHLRCGVREIEIQGCAETLRPALVVIGTAAREGIGGWVMGNTSEKLLATIGHDLLVVPAS